MTTFKFSTRKLYEREFPRNKKKAFGSITLERSLPLSESDNNNSKREPFGKNQFRFQSIKLHNGIFDKFFILRF